MWENKASRHLSVVWPEARTKALYVCLLQGPRLGQLPGPKIKSPTILHKQRVVLTTSHSMPPKRQKEAKPATPSKRARTDKSDSDNRSDALVQSLISDKLLGQTYCEELGIDLSKGSHAVFQWLACSSMFGSRLSEVKSPPHHSCKLQRQLCALLYDKVAGSSWSYIEPCCRPSP